MLSSPQDSVISSPESFSNKRITAETVSETVMAEQISHNVVNNTESTSGQPLVDVAANQNTIASAELGSSDQPTLETKDELAQTRQDANEYAIETNALTSSALSEAQAAETAAEPSAGDATGSNAPTSEQSTNSEQVPLANGVHDPALTTGGLAEDARSVDVSVNSDTEGSRGDASEQKLDEKHHTRTNSVKKPTTFSKVSVSKNFLAKSATATPPVAKAGDKPTPVGTPPQHSVARPRLIAKTGASVVQKTRLGAEGAGGPDASKVWNKNRPVAPPPPKQFTDEELKQQYGIHLATRLQTDENGKESKWADIDDDEDDWTPDTVVWMDGTKSTLTPQDVVPIPEKQLPAPQQPLKPVEGVRPALAIKKQTELGPTKTILKPGASIAATQAKQGDLPGGTLAEKASLKVKSPAPAPSKSPWAALPPVEKINPVNPPVQQPQPPPPFVSQDARAYEQPMPFQPAREIAADTFDRSWREGEGGTRELFNSANGRYEPVTEGRRSSIKPELSFRKPAVLQRPSQNAPPAPVEPSPAFQTRTASQSEGSWGRRRGSSVSQGSIPPVRRMSVTKGSEMSPAPERRTSTVVGHDMRTSPKMARTEPAQPAFSQQSAWAQQMPARPEADAPEKEDPVKVQEKIMRETRELAKKRRQEEEERLEAEKQERLKARLAQLEGAGKSRKEREAEAAVAAATPTTDKPAEVVLPTISAEETRAQPAQPAEMAAMAAPALEEQSLPAVPTDTRIELPSPEEQLPSPLPPKMQPSGLPDRPISSADQSQRELPRSHLSPRASVRIPFQQQSTAYRPPPSSYSSPGDRKQQPFGRSQLPNNGGFSPWPTTAPNSNVWGTGIAGIGNGTFESANGFALMPQSQQNSALPPPPGMTRPSTSTRISPQSLAQESRSPNLQQQSVTESHRGYAPPGFESRPDPFASQARANGTSPIPGLARQSHAPGPIAPPSRSQQYQPSSTQRDALDAWNSAAVTLPNQYKAEADAAERKKSDTVSSAPREDTIKETFKKTSVSQGRLGAPRRFEVTEYAIHDAQGTRSVQSLSPAPPVAQTQPSGPFSTASPMQPDPWRQAENTVRIPDGSLNPAHGGLPPQQPPIAPPSSTQSALVSYQGNVNFPTAPLPPTLDAKEQSPPPPETSSHPVNNDVAGRPHVKLPVIAKVKLPPAPTPAQPPMAPSNTVMPPQRPVSGWGLPGSVKPIVMQEAWQQRFNGLFNRTPIQTETPPSPPKTPPKMQGPALAVASSTRAVMDEETVSSGATVSLPSPKRVLSAEGFTIDDSRDVVSKPTTEQMFTEELSFGSTPKVSIPRVHRNDTYEAASYRSAPVNALIGRKSEPAETQSSSGFNLFEVHHKRADGVFVHLPQIRLNRLVKWSVKHDARESSGFNQDRKASGRWNKGKPRADAPSSPNTNASPSNGLRKTSLQKTSTPAPEAKPGSNAGPEASKKSSTWARPAKGPPRARFGKGPVQPPSQAATSV